MKNILQPTLLFFFFLAYPVLNIAQVNVSDSLELVNFYNATCNDGCTLAWDFSQPVDTWRGIEVTDGRVTGINGRYSGLSGHIPDLNLPQLTYMTLGRNSLSGTIPNFTYLQNLTLLSLYDNELGGTITNFTYLPNLLRLSLDGNSLNGTIPDFTHLQNLTFLGLSDNELSGSITAFTNLPNLSGLNIGGNSLSDTIPDFTHLQNLTNLILSNNKLSGIIPNFTHLQNLKNVDLSNNQLSGCFSDDLLPFCNYNFNLDVTNNPELPDNGNFHAFCQSQFGSCDYVYIHENDSLELVKLYNTTCDSCLLSWDFNQPANLWDGGIKIKNGRVTEIKLDDKDLSGNIPDLSGLPNLSVISFKNNQFGGCFPQYLTNLCSWSNNYAFGGNSGIIGSYNSFNEFCNRSFGSCDYVYVEPSDSLALVELYNATCNTDCTLTWDISKPVNQWDSDIVITDGRITSLAIGDRGLSGSLPDLNLPRLKSLTLIRNNLSGSVPNFTNLMNLQYLNISNNAFTGRIPDLSSLNSLKTFYIHSNQLSDCFSETLLDFCEYPYSFRFGNNPGLPGNGNFDAFCDRQFGSCNYVYVNESDSLELVKFYNTACDSCQLGWNLNQPVNLWDGGIEITNGRVTKLDVSYKELSGNLPDLNLPELVEIDVSRNELTGNIPSFDGLPKLIKGRFEFNQFSGCFPDALKKYCGDAYDFSFSMNPDLPAGGNLSYFCNNDFGTCSYVFVEPSDSIALVDFYNATCNNDCTLGWDLTQPVNHWDGIRIEDGRVTEIYMYNRQLSDSIPPLNLPNLTKLNLTRNQLNGPIPNFLNLPDLKELTLAQNQFSGSIPDFSNLPNLQALDLGQNQLSGPIPNFLNSPNLVSIGLGHNQLSDTIPSFAHLSNLNSLYLNNNQLSEGCFDIDLIHLCSITYKNFKNNPNLPGGGDFWGFCTYGKGSCNSLHPNDSLALVSFYIAHCGQYCDLNWTFQNPVNTWDGVQVSGNRVTGLYLRWERISGQLTDLNLPELTSLQLINNALSGPIPDFTNLPKLKILDLSGNDLSDSIPTFVNLPQLKSLNLSANNLVGGIGNITNLPNLNEIDLSHNELNDCFSPALLDLCEITYNFEGNSGLPQDGDFEAFCTDGIGYCDIIDADSLELVKLYNATCQDGCLLDWDFEQPVSSWEGILTSYDRVSEIKLVNRGLKGAIPDLNLPSLEVLDLSSNQLNGTIPNFSLPKLKVLQFYFNQLTGNIPTFDLPDITTLSLGRNQLTGTIPDFDLPNLTTLSLGSNQLTGTIPDFDLPNLTTLSLGENQLTGSLPSFTGLPNVKEIHVFFNQLSGCFSDDLIPLCDITVHAFGNPNLPDNGNFQLFCDTGAGNCFPTNSTDSLELVNFYAAVCNDSCTLNWDFDTPVTSWEGILTDKGAVIKVDLASKGLSGDIPDINLPKLKILRLNNNLLTGQIPSFANLTNVELIDISNNALSGCFGTNLSDFCDITFNVSNNIGLPNNGDFYAFCSTGYGDCTPIFPDDSLELVKLYNATCNDGCILDWDLNQAVNTWEGVQLDSNRVTAIAIYNKGLSDAIPELNLPELLELNLVSNDLTGSIPEYTNLPKLESINLSGNDLSGSIPEFANLINLKSLRLSGNPLNSNLPLFESLSNLEYIYANSCQLSGEIPEYRHLVNLKFFYASHNNLTGDIPVAFASLPNLESLYLRDNNLSGCFADSLLNLCNIDYDFEYNYGLPGNGNFYDFCNSGFGNCYPTNVSDSLELVKLYNATCHENCHLDWDSTKLVSAWSGLTIEDGRVTEVILYNKRLSGTIPDLNLPMLTRLSLADNQLVGNIPNLIGLPNLERIYLNDNQLSGCFPDELLDYCNINYDFSSNSGLPNNGDFATFCTNGSGSCTPTNPSDSLELVNFYNAVCNHGCTLNWNFNDLVSTWEGISSVGGKVLEINIHSKGLSGSIPDLNLPNLTRISLVDNDLIGTIPSFSHTPDLEVINLLKNDLTGAIPTFTHLQNLAKIDLSNNQLSGCFPESLTRFCAIRYNFRDNPDLPGNGDFQEFCHRGFGSCTPANLNDSLELVNFYELACLDGCTLDWELEQPLNTWTGIGTKHGRVLSIRLNSKGLNGAIPNLNLPQLKYLDLSNNSLIGSIPVFTNLPNLENINLRSNQLSSCFSDELLPLCDINYDFSNNPDLPDRGNFRRFCSSGFGSCTPANLSDSLELVKFYELTCTDGCTLNWKFDEPVNTWGGIYTLHGRVKGIYLNSINLTGAIPDLNLHQLSYLNLNNNNFNDTIPLFANSPNLRQIYLDNNQLSGNIPKFSLLKLTTISLQNNQLSENIPDFFLPNLEYLNLTRNQLSGDIPSFSNLSNLTSLYLTHNQLSGNIPDFSLSNLVSLVLSHNQLSGNMPDLSNVTKLKRIYVNDNQLSGCFPEEFISFCNIDYDFSNNPELPDNGNFTNFCNGTLVPCNGAINPSDSLELVKFYNTLCNEDCTLNWNLNDLVSTWEGVWLSGSRVTGIQLFPVGLNGNLPDLNLPYLNTLILFENQLTGSIPDFSNLPNLKILALVDNMLTGSIPNFTNLPNLKQLILDNNQLTGKIPNLYMTQVEGLGLRNNRLSGTIPILYAYDIDIAFNEFSQQDIAVNFNNINAGDSFSYSPQYFGNEQFHTDTIGATVVLSPDPSIPYASPSIRWLQNDEFITPNYALNDTTYIIPSLDTVDIGIYQYRFIDYTLSPEVEFYSRPINNYVEGLDLEGEPIIQGELILEYGVNQSPTEIDSIRNELITNYGGIILDSCGCKVQLDLWKFGDDDVDIVREVIGINGTHERRTSSTEIDGNRDNLIIPDYNEAEYILIGNPVENPNDSAKVVVGVIDTGVNVFHNAIYDNLWRNQTEQNGISGIDDDNNGYADDIFGYDFVSDSLMHDTHGHGTKVGGIITANTPQNMDIQVMPVRTFNEEGRGSLFDMLCGVYYAVDNGSDIVNISAGYKGQKSVILQKALQYGRDRDVLFVVAAGNDTLNLDAVNYWPATFTRDSTLENTVLTVTALDSTYNLTDYASYGDSTISIATSGQGLLAPAGYDTESFDYISGTSASAPVISLALATEKIKTPNKSSATLREDFLNNVDIAANLINVVQEGRMLNVEVRQLSKLRVFLEGALLNFDGTYRDDMKTILNQRGLLPGQKPVSSLAVPTPAGQPYKNTPWNYNGIEWANTDNYLEDRVDWVLVSLRTEAESDTEIYRTAAQVKKDGTVEFYRPIEDLTGIADSVYIVVEHRNHMAVMSSQKVPVYNGRFVYDFTKQDSYKDPTSVGQVEVKPGVWAMILGDSSQENDQPYYDINGDDKAIWVNENGIYDQYLRSDYDMDGDVNGNDKKTWSYKIGLSNRVPK